MRALVLDADGRPRLDLEHPEPTPGAEEAIVHVRLAGICATDLELVRGYAGYRGVLGHEFVGIVDGADEAMPGRRVVADINVGCGRCVECRTHAGHHCRNRTTLGIRDRPGVFAERVAIPRANLVEVPASVPNALAVFAEPLAAALHVLDDVEDLDPSSWITVLGDGKLGLLIALALAAAGRKTALIGRHPDKLAIAAAVGVKTTLESMLTADASQAAPVVVEATGSAAGLTRALSLVEPRGTIIMKTTTAVPVAVDLTPIVVHELRLLGSRCGDMQRAIDLLASGRIDPRPLVVARYTLARAVHALEHAAQPGMLKVVLEL